jgi:acyl-CoA dehydrogenase
MAEFFDAKGLLALKAEDRAEAWYDDWIAYQAMHGLYAGVLSPKSHSTRGSQFDLLKLTRFWEASAYFSPAHAYGLHVTFLGLYPILRSGGDDLKREAVAKLEAGGVFGLGVSEREHGADLLGNEFTVTEVGPGRMSARGSKHYIGNAQAAAMLAVLAKRGRRGPDVGLRRAPFLLFALRPTEPGAVRSMRKIRTSGVRTAYVGAFDVEGYEFPASDVICAGRAAWETVLATVTLGKFFLGFGSIGGCEHALEEARAHTRSRLLYGKPVADMPHIRAAMVHAYAKLTAMKLFAFRALDYLHAARADDRRFLLFAAVQKATVGSEAVKVMALLSECVGAKGFEADTYFETALRDVPLVPVLEGSTHINYLAVAHFLRAYFARRTRGAAAPGSPPSLTSGSGVVAAENPYVMELQPGDEQSVRFAPFLDAYGPIRSVRNVVTFVRQVRAFRRFTRTEAADDRLTDPELNIAVGRCVSVIVYSQLVAEHCGLAGTPPELVAVLFQQLIEALTAESLRLAALPQVGAPARALLAGATAVPQTTQSDIEFVAGRIAAQT